MTKKDRKEALDFTCQKSKDGNLYYLLLSRSGAESFITDDAEMAKYYVRNFGYKVYAKCQDGYMVL